MRQAVSRVKVSLEGAQRKKRAAVGKETYVTEKYIICSRPWIFQQTQLKSCSVFSVFWLNQLEIQ